jgi:hypothetical protein
MSALDNGAALARAVPHQDVQPYPTTDAAVTLAETLALFGKRQAALQAEGQQ